MHPWLTLMMKNCVAFDLLFCSHRTAIASFQMLSLLYCTAYMRNSTSDAVNHNQLICKTFSILNYRMRGVVLCKMNCLVCACFLSLHHSILKYIARLVQIEQLNLACLFHIMSLLRAVWSILVHNLIKNHRYVHMSRAMVLYGLCMVSVGISFVAESMFR